MNVQSNTANPREVEHNVTSRALADAFDLASAAYDKALHDASASREELASASLAESDAFTSHYRCRDALATCAAVDVDVRRSLNDSRAAYYVARNAKRAHDDLGAYLFGGE